MIDSTVEGSVFDRHSLLIARMDQLTRNEDLLVQLEASDWDLVVVDEAHRMSAHYFGQELTEAVVDLIGLSFIVDAFGTVTVMSEIDTDAAALVGLDEQRLTAARANP